MQNLVRDLNGLYRQQPALHQLDCSPEGFAWISNDDADQSTLAWLRHDGKGGCVLVISNFTPVPRTGFDVGMPADAPSTWREALNTDSRHYGGTDVGNGATLLHTQARAAHGPARSLHLNIPPLATVFLVPA